MPAIDFSEILSDAGGPDTFEWFARDFLEVLGFQTVCGPDRGADSGRDLVMREVRVGPTGETHVDWLVSCKHFAHSNRAVGPGAERDIRDRVEANACKGFLAFYSTGITSGLASKLNSKTLGVEVAIFDRELIEKRLVGDTDFRELSRRYFPVSMERWLQEHPLPASVFAEQPVISCDNCNRNLLVPAQDGIVVYIERRTGNGTTIIEHVYTSCKGACDRVLTGRHRGDRDLCDSWADLDDLAIPLLHVRAVAATLNQLHSVEYRYSPEAFEKLKRVLLWTFPLVAREATAKEKERIATLGGVPEWLGGLG